MRRASRPSNVPPTILHHYLSELDVNWSFVRNYLDYSPKEARKLNQHGATPLFKALYRRHEDYPTFEIIKQLIEAYPLAIWETNDPDQCPLNAACWRRASLPILELLLSSRPSRANDVEALGALWKSYVNLFGDDFIMTTVLEGGREGVEIWTKLCMVLQYCTSQTMETYQCLHALSSTPKCPLPLLELSLSLFPEQIRQPDTHGRLPLHYYVAQSSGDASFLIALHLFLSTYPEAATIRDNQSLRLPFHIAIAKGHEWETIQLLLKAPDMWSEVDGVTQLYPFQLAACTNACSLSAVFSLLRAAPHLVQDGIEKEHVTVTSLSALQANSAATRLGILQTNVLLETNESRLVQWGSDELLWANASKLLAHRTPGADWCAVHAAASLPGCPIGLLELVVTLRPQELSHQDATGSLPLHIVITASSSSQIGCAEDRALHSDNSEKDEEDMRTRRLQLVLENYPQAAQLRDRQGRLPLHLAVCARQPWESLEALIHAHPTSVCRRDDRGLHPFQVAATVQSPRLTVIYQLLLAAPHLVVNETNVVGV